MSTEEPRFLHSTVEFATSEANHIQRVARWLDGRCQECGVVWPYVKRGRACVTCLDREAEEAF